MKFLRLMLVVFTIGFSTNCNAITVRGAPSCGNWFEDATRIGSKHWLNGFLSGAAAQKGEDILGVVDADSVFLWMDNYCRNNPLDSVFQGATKLTKELEKRIK